MKTLAQMIDALLEREGGYVNHPDDRGGATNYGITQRTYTKWRVQHNLGFKDVRDITKEDAREIYREGYWTPAHCDELPEAVREVHFDAAVNHGVMRAIKLLQEAVGTQPDGRLGPATLAAANQMNPQLLAAKYVVARFRFYGEIVQRDRSQLTFIAGWMRRMNHFT